VAFPWGHENYHESRGGGVVDTTLERNTTLGECSVQDRFTVLSSNGGSRTLKFSKIDPLRGCISHPNCGDPRSEPRLVSPYSLNRPRTRVERTKHPLFQDGSRGAGEDSDGGHVSSSESRIMTPPKLRWSHTDGPAGRTVRIGGAWVAFGLVDASV
jgi:hypothetical protein